MNTLVKTDVIKFELIKQYLWKILFYLLAPIRMLIHRPITFIYYILSLYIAVAVIVYFIIRVKYPFWSKQPVFHAGIWMLYPWRFWRPSGILIQPNELIKFYKSSAVRKKPYSDWIIRDIVRYKNASLDKYRENELNECNEFLKKNFYHRTMNGDVEYRPV